MQRYLRKGNVSVIILLTLIWFAFSPLREGWSGEQAPFPTIEELTGGKVKTGDSITKENVDLVKDYLTVGIYDLVKQGMIMKIGKNVAPGEVTPAYFREATENSLKLHGKPTVDENAVIYTKEGKTWPGGIPFPAPSNVLELMADVKYGHGVDDFEANQYTLYVNKEGKAYKTNKMNISWVWTNGRLKVPPLGAVPGFETANEVNLPVFVAPQDLKGLGQLSIKYWDDLKNPDAGFVYLPAFKRVIRVSATTYQDNMGGSDMTWGDPNGLREPFSNWKFKLIAKKFMLAGYPYGEAAKINPDLSVDDGKEYTEGKKFAKNTWVVTPVYIVEATPKIKHIYGKKILYIRSPEEAWFVYSNIGMVDIYDQQMRLWKAYYAIPYLADMGKGQPRVSVGPICSMHDLQAGHQTHFLGTLFFNRGLDPAKLDLNALIAKGK
jgi:hypothetical protein